MTLTIYGWDQAVNVLRVLVVCKEKNVDYNVVHVDLFTSQQREASFVTHQPFAKIPYISDDGFELYESRAISRYIALKYADQGTPLIPPTSDLRATGRFEQAASIEQNNFEFAARGYASEKMFKPVIFGKTTDEKAAEAYLARLNTALDVYDQILGKQKYLAGEDITLADIFHLPLGNTLTNKLHLDVFERRPNVYRWWQDISSRPSWTSLVGIKE